MSGNYRRSVLLSCGNHRYAQVAPCYRAILGRVLGGLPGRWSYAQHHFCVRSRRRNRDQRLQVLTLSFFHNSALRDRGMMLDTGAFGTYIPPEYLAEIYGPVEGSSLLEDGAWSVPCDTKMNVSVMFGCVRYSFPRTGEVLIYDVWI